MKNKITIDGKDFELPESLVNEIRQKLVDNEPTTFEECCKKFNVSYSVNIYGNIITSKDGGLENGSFVTSQKRALQLAAISKMMTVADALNDSWTFKPNMGELGYKLYINKYMTCSIDFHDDFVSSPVYFKTRALIEKAIKILGEDVIKTAFRL